MHSYLAPPQLRQRIVRWQLAEPVAHISIPLDPLNFLSQDVFFNKKNRLSLFYILKCKLHNTIPSNVLVKWAAPRVGVSVMLSNCVNVQCGEFILLAS